MAYALTLNRQYPCEKEANPYCNLLNPQYVPHLSKTMPCFEIFYDCALLEGEATPPKEKPTIDWLVNEINNEQGLCSPDL